MKKTIEKKDELSADIAAYLKLKDQSSDLDKKMSDLKDKITAQANHRYVEFEDGELVLETGKLKVMLNPPKMVFEASGKTVTPAQRTAISPLLPEAYRTVDLNVKLIYDRMSADKLLARGLKGQGVSVLQDTRFDVKPLK